MKKLIAIVALIASISSMAQTVNCTSTDDEYFDFDLTLQIDGVSAQLTNNSTATVDSCVAEDLGDGVTGITCDDIGIMLAGEEIDIEGGNAMYQTSNGMRGFLDCK